MSNDSRLTKGFIEKGIVFPLITAVAVTAVVFSLTPFAKHYVPFYKDELCLASFCEEKTVEAQKISPSQAAVSKASLGITEGNTEIGTLNADGQTLNLIYNADYYNTSKGDSLVSERLPGETGAAYIYGYKTQMQFLYNIEQGDTFTLSLCYGDYEFKVINADAVTGENNVLSRNPNVEHGIVIYTNCDEGAGISSKYYVVTAEMTSGAAVEE